MTEGERYATRDEAEAVELAAGRFFLPNTPISVKELFSGRRTQIRLLLDTVHQPGLHAAVFGERGVGKTSLANIVKPLLDVGGAEGGKAMLAVRVPLNSADDFSSAWYKAFGELTVPIPGMGFKPAAGSRTSLAAEFFSNKRISIDAVRRTLADIGDSVFVFDEFDRLPRDVTKAFTDLIKCVSDYTLPATIVIVGVSETIDALIEDHNSITRSLTQIHMPRMPSDELRAILEKGEQRLGVRFEDYAADFIVKMSQGLPHYTHLIGQCSVRTACQRMSRVISREDVEASCNKTVESAQHHTMMSGYSIAIRSSHRDALYAHVLLACAIAASRSIDELGYFQPTSVIEPLQAILPKRRIQHGTFDGHLSEFCDERRSGILERTGAPRSYRYRFADPLMPSFVMLQGLARALIDSDTLRGLLRSVDPPTAPSGQEVHL